MNDNNKNKINGYHNNWDEHWENERQLNWFGKRLHQQQYRVLNSILSNNNISKDAKIIDIGCGSGRAINDCRKLGYKNCIGIDNSIKSIELCKEFNFIEKKDVFLMDAINTLFIDNEFELVFSQGLLEHFKDFSPIVKEMTRISSKYILIFQPNHFSIFRKIVDFTSGVVVDEYTNYKTEDFIHIFTKFGSRLINRIDYNFNEQYALLFVKE